MTVAARMLDEFLVSFFLWQNTRDHFRESQSWKKLLLLLSETSKPRFLYDLSKTKLNLSK